MNPKLLIAILVFIALIAIFFLTYVLNKKTPVPKGCEKVENEHCVGCANKACEFYKEENKE